MSVGENAIRVDAEAKVTGEATYPADRFPDDALVAKVVFTDQPHAELMALDTAAAEAVPGVIAVFTAADVPVNEYGLTMPDQPVFSGPGPASGSDGPRVDPTVSRWEADHLALVVAETMAAAGAGASDTNGRHHASGGRWCRAGENAAGDRPDRRTSPDAAPGRGAAA